MILVLGQKNDASTTDVAEWLLYYNKKFLVLNTDDEDFKILKFDLNNEEFLISVNNEVYNLHDISTVWNRRYGISPNIFTSRYLDNKSPEPFFMEKGDRFHVNQLMDESKTLFDFIHYLIEKETVFKIGSFFSNRVNKLIVLSKAKECGLNIPESYIFTNKDDIAILKNHINSRKNLITKAIHEGVYRPDVREKYIYFSNVERVSDKDIDGFSSEFYPSLIQVEVEKKLELRVLFLHDKFYPMAIFSQDEEAAKVDFRKNPHHETPLKYVPYKLPAKIEVKLLNLMSKLKLNTGSIDLILDKNNRYIFLEVNPAGQYTMTSIPCNYFIDKKIAQLL